jgi:hypothetical protein
MSMVSRGIDTVIADFDMTLTKFLNPITKQRSMTSHGALENWSRLPKTVKQRMDFLSKKYYPMEVDPHLDKAEKRRAMVPLQMN